MEAGRELDALVAEKVMGWRRMTEGEVHPGARFDIVYPAAAKAGFDRTRLSDWWFDAVRRDENGDAVSTHPVEEIVDYGYTIPAFSPSTDIAAAWEVVKKLDPKWWPEVGRMHNDGGWYCEICLGGNAPVEVGPPIRHVAKTAPLAICLAALKAVGVEVK